MIMFKDDEKNTILFALGPKKDYHIVKEEKNGI